MVIFAFWMAAMLLCLAALALLLPPLLRRRGSANNGQRRDIERQLADLKSRHDAGTIDAAAYASERDTLSQRLIATIENSASTSAAPAPRLALTLALMLPVAALALYFVVGQPQVLDKATLARAAAPGGSGMQQDLDQAIAALEQRLRQQPDDINGWLLLARTYRSLERFDDMLRATSSAFALSPQSPDIMAEHAEALTLASSDRRFGAQARQLLESALATEPQHQKTLWLLGVAELQAQRAPEAVTYWRRLRALVPDDDPVARSIDQQIANALGMEGADSRLADDPGSAGETSGSTAGDAIVDAAPASGTTTDNAAALAGSTSASAANAAAAPLDTAGPVLTVRIELADALRNHVTPGDTLFVFVRAPTGGPPLAIKRITNPGFPLDVTLSQADRMLEGVQMETGSEVTLAARLSKSGQAQAQPGDLEAASQILQLAATNTATLQLDRVAD